MAADPWVFYNSFKTRLGDGTIDLDNHEFKVALFTSAHTPNTSSQASYTTLTGQVAQANGYLTGGKALVNRTWTLSNNTMIFDAEDPTWDIAGGSLTARYAVLYDNTDTAKSLVAYCLLDNTPADVVVTDGNRLTIQLNPNGIFRLT